MNRIGLAAVIVSATAASTHAQTFSRVEFYPEMRLDYVLVVADLNADGRDDIVAGGREERDTSVDQQPEDRHDTSALEVFFGVEDGTFRHAPELVDGAIETRRPFVVAADSTMMNRSTSPSSTRGSSSSRRASATAIRRSSG